MSRLLPALLLAFLVAGCDAGVPSAESDGGEGQPGEANPCAESQAAKPAPEPAAQPAPKPVQAPPGVVIPERLPMASEVPPRSGLIPNGSFAPDFKLKRLDKAGGTFQLSDYVNPKASGKADGALVAFMASWCGICHQSLPTLKQLKDTHGDRLQIVILSVDENETLAKKEAETVANAGLDVPVVWSDSATSKAWLGGGTGVPRYFFLNKIGEVMVRDKGFGAKVKPMMPRQAAYVLAHPEYVVRN